MAKHFGGDWTKKKLDVLEDYLKSYLKVLKQFRSHFSVGYIDAFAGDGSIQLATSESEATSPLLHAETTEIAGLIRGSAQRALELDPGFDGYVFIEKDKQAAKRLLDMQAAYPGKKIRVMPKDANECLIRICSENDWTTRRAVVFLDPTGMQVDWKTMEAIAATGAMDVWIWFPLGVGPNRMLTRSGEFPQGWRPKLNRMFGTPDWESEFYAREVTNTLFGQMDVTRKIAAPEDIGRYYNKRLAEIFPAVAPNPRVMHNSTGNPIYLLCFASANKGKGGKIAIGIAKHLLNKA